MINQQRKILFYILTLVLFLFLPIFQLLFGFFSPTYLHGIELPKTYVKFNYRSFREESFQKSLEEYLVKSNELWGYALQIGNQFYYSIFNQVSPKLNNSVLSGNDGQFFQSMYLSSYNKSRKLNIDKMHMQVDRLKLVSEDLKRRGKLLILLISPNTIHLYPESLPNSYKTKVHVSEINSYELFMPEIEKSGVLYFDTTDFLVSLKDKNYKYQGAFFQKTGSHLNDIGVCHQVNGILNLSSKKFLNVPKLLNCNDFEYIYPPLKRDIDLIEIANLLYPERYFFPSPKLNQKDPNLESANEKLNFLMIGTSFLFGIQNALEVNHISNRATLYFYNKTYRERYKDQFIPKKISNWVVETEKYDVIIVEANHSFLSRMGYGFLKEYLRGSIK